MADGAAIKLNDTEAKICNLLIDFTNSPERHAVFSKDIVLRITGGWVRDKLLGLQSNDLDIAINSYTGLEFAEQLNLYISKHSNSLGLSAKNIHKIEKNPEKSKHLETATTKLYGLDIDFVNLRCEEYADDSRIPTTRFGTAEEDAYRRDATLNALFYNIQDANVEDLTGRGLQDLKEGILRTPLDPFETFKEDPLRVLRLIRFASRFGFSIAPDALATMKDKVIHTALMQKISRERVGTEISKCLNGPRPAQCLELVSTLSLEEAVFSSLPRDTKSNVPSYSTFPKSTLSDSISNLTRALEDPRISPHYADIPPSFKLFSWLGLPYLRIHGRTGKIGKKDNSLTYIFITEALKMISTSDSAIVATGVDLVSTTTEIAQTYQTLTRRQLGQYIRQCGQYWKLYVLFGLVHSLNSNKEAIAHFTGLLSKIETLQLGDAWSLRPLLNGGEVQKALNKKPGPWMAAVMDQILALQLENPETNKDDCLHFLDSIKDSIAEQSQVKKQRNV